MMLFYADVVVPPLHEFDWEESAHLVRVLRMKTEDECLLTDGKGTLYRCRLIDPSPKKCRVEILSSESIARQKHRLHIAIAPTKNICRFEWFLEKATEIGIQEITPLICTHAERTVLKQERLNKVIISALKQSQQYWLPVLHEPLPFKEMINAACCSQKFIAWCETGDEELFVRKCTPAMDTMILIGPEGDFSLEEVIQAKQAGFIPVSLGSNRLRTETAGVVGCAVFQFVNNRISS